MRLAGMPILPLYAVLVHRGRKSGTTFRTPVVVHPTGDGFVVPMPFGEHTDWFRNIRASGECVIQWKGREYSMVQPEVIDSATISASFNTFQRAFMRRVGIERCLHVRHRSAAVPTSRAS
jgi:deazaflavin-dependent oxidoreductase (nitroreductase family)